MGTALRGPTACPRTAGCTRPLDVRTIGTASFLPVGTREMHGCGAGKRSPLRAAENRNEQNIKILIEQIVDPSPDRTRELA